MNFIDFIIKLLQSISPIGDSNLAVITDDANKWYNSIIVNKPGEDELQEKGNKLEKKLKSYTQEWWMKILLGFLYPYAKHYFYILANPELTIDEDEEED